MLYPGDGEHKKRLVATDIVDQHREHPGVDPDEHRSSFNPIRVHKGVREYRSLPSARTTLINIFIVDDHTLLREGLRRLFDLEEDLHVVGEASNGFEAIEKIGEARPDVVLLDMSLPVMDGVATTREIVQRYPGIAVIILSIQRQNQQVVEAIRNGARGYLLKQASIHEVTQAIRTIHEGGTVVSSLLTGTLVNELRHLPEQSTSQHGLSQLTEKEIEIVRYLTEGLSNKEIAEQLAYSEKTVKNYLSIIFQKLQLRDRTQVAIFALRQGLLLENPRRLS